MTQRRIQYRSNSICAFLGRVYISECSVVFECFAVCSDSVHSPIVRLKLALLSQYSSQSF